MEHITPATTELPFARGFLARVAAFIACRWKHHQDRKSYRATLRTLQGMDDHTLKDIGISRHEIEVTVWSDRDYLRCKKHQTRNVS